MQDTALFRSLSTRITAGVIFTVLVIMMLYGQLPYQLPINPSKAQIVKLNHQIIAIVATCSLILLFFIPTKKMALYTTICMFCLFLSYNTIEAKYLENWMFCVPLFPFCMDNEKMFTQLRYQKWIIPVFLLLVIIQYGTKVFNSASIILYLLPYLPFHTITNWISNQLEPR